MDDATWGVFAEGWRDGLGADADHLKTAADIDACAAAGFTFFTIDPGDHVDNAADQASSPAAAARRPPRCPGTAWTTRWTASPRRYAGQTVELEGHTHHLRRGHGPARRGQVRPRRGPRGRHVPPPAPPRRARPSSWRCRWTRPTRPPRHAEHVYIASELRAPGRALGQPGAALRRPLREGRGLHRRPGRLRGRLSPARRHRPPLRPLQAQPALRLRQVQHLPHRLRADAGGWCTSRPPARSYLEALRTLAALDPALFREIYAFARERYPTDRASYHVSAELAKAPRARDPGRRRSSRLCWTSSTPARCCTSPSARC